MIFFKILLFFLCAQKLIFCEVELDYQKLEKSSKILDINITEEKPLEILSDEVLWNDKTKVLTISGNVKITQRLNNNKTREIKADFVIYNEDTKKITAHNNVILKEPEGDLLYADYMDLDDNFDDGIMQGLKVLTTDKSRFNAKEAIREKGNITTLTNADYSPCKLCEKGKKTLTWKLEAKEVIHNQEEKMIYYKNVFLVFKGIKVFYSPYFSHPDPSVKNKNGLLTPTIGYSNNLGAYISVPYLLTNGNQDLTIAPMLMTRQNPLIATEYRKRIKKGEFSFSGSITQNKDKKNQKYVHIPRKNRWNVSSLTNCSIDDNSRLKIDLNKSSDTNYLTKYRLNRQNASFTHQKNLTSEINYERFDANSYFQASSYYFQTDTPKTTPIILPYLHHNYKSNVFKHGGYLNISSNVLAINRVKPEFSQTAKQTIRFSSNICYLFPYVFDSGQMLDFVATNRLDAYYSKKYNEYNYDKTLNDKKVGKSVNSQLIRYIPQAHLKYRMPLIHQNKIWVLEPQASISIAPSKINKAKIPNNDCRTISFDQTNILSNNRFNGIDKFDEGQRLAYGIDNRFNLNTQKRLELFLGQSLRLDGKTVIGKEQGESKNFSDYITKISYFVNDFVYVYSQNSFKKDLSSRVNLTGIGIGKPILRIEASYAQTQKNYNNLSGALSQISYQISSLFKENWQVHFAQIINTHNPNKGILANFAGISYEDDCFNCKLSVYNSKYQDRDIKPESGFFLQISFKNIGSFTPSSTQRYQSSLLTGVR